MEFLSALLSYFFMTGGEYADLCLNYETYLCSTL